MHIVYIHQHYRTPEMVGGTRSYEFSRRLAAKGHTVHMIAGTPTDDAAGQVSTRATWRITEEAGVTVHWCVVPYSHHMGFRDRLRSFSSFALRSAHRAHQLSKDVVFATSTPLTVAVPGVYAARRTGAPLVFEVRDVWPEVPIAMGMLQNPALRRAALGLEAWAYRHADSVVALSPDMTRSITSRFPNVRVSTIPNSSDVAFFRETTAESVAQFRSDRPWLGDAPLVVYAGTFGPANGMGYLVNFAEALAEFAPRVRVLLVGGGKDGAEVEARARRAGVLDMNFFMEPPVAKSEMPTVLAAADLCVSLFADLPALSANSPNKAFDAFASGTPVAINNGGWLADVLAESGAGIAMPAGDPRTGARLVADHITDARWLQEAGRAAASLARDRFDRDTLFEQFESVLLDAVEHRSATRQGVP